ncbi:MAG TPA: hypothetical protein VNX21_00310 [Candidatus Thermoplasmatota archaeon]|nr:hypothetical protein [Candidatus Thermoplasmatota archaeon]
MRTLPLLLLVALPLAAVPASGSSAAPACVSVRGDVSCDFAVSVYGSASGGFLAASGTGEATTYMDRCLEWVCPSVAVSGWNDAHAGCHASSICLAVAGKGHATHEGYGWSVGGCDVLYAVCYPVLP